MEKKHCDIDETKRYLQGKMTAEESAHFEDNLVNDPQFRQDFEFNKDLLESIRTHFGNELKNKLKEVDENHSARQSRSRFFIPVIGIAATVSILVFFFIKIVINTTDYQVLFDQYYSPYYNILGESERSVNKEDGNLAMRLYDQKRYEEAIRVFDNLIEQDPDNSAFRFYKALSHLELDQTASAIESLKMVVNKSDKRFEEPARWYLGLAYVNAEEIEKAKETFRDIIANESSYSERAVEILNRIN